MDTNSIKYPIRRVSEITGVQAVTLRAWQRRFGLINPDRTEKGHRLYSEDDIKRVNQIVKWLEKGVSISQVKPLLGEDENQIKTPSWQNEINKLIECSMMYQDRKLDNQINQILSLYPFQLASHRIIKPWLEQTNDICKNRIDGKSLEAWLSQQMTIRLNNHLYHRLLHNDGVRVLVVSPRPINWWQPLLMHCEVSEHNYRVIPVTDTPLDQLENLTSKVHAEVVLLNLNSGESFNTLTNIVLTLEKNKITHYVTGPYAKIYQENCSIPMTPRFDQLLAND